MRNQTYHAYHSALAFSIVFGDWNLRTEENRAERQSLALVENPTVVVSLEVTNWLK